MRFHESRSKTTSTCPNGISKWQAQVHGQQGWQTSTTVPSFGKEPEQERVHMSNHVIVLSRTDPAGNDVHVQVLLGYYAVKAHQLQ